MPQSLLYRLHSSRYRSELQTDHLVRLADEIALICAQVSHKLQDIGLGFFGLLVDKHTLLSLEHHFFLQLINFGLDIT